MAPKLSPHDRAAIALHDILVELAKTACEEKAAREGVERLRVQAREADVLFRAKRAFRRFQTS